MKWNKRVLAVLMQWDYCDKRRGVSGDKLIFFDVISKLVSNLDVFWYDEYVNDPDTLRKIAYKKAEALNPDLIFFATYTDQFDPATLDAFKARWPTCAWFGDDSWRFENYTAKLAPHFSYVCTTDIFSIEKYRKIGVEPILSQWAAQQIGSPRKALGPGDKYKYDVSFVGGYNEVRGWFIKMLQRQGISVECFGHGWPNGMVTFEEMAEIFNESKISLNLSNSVSKDVRFVFGGPRNFARFLLSPKNVEQMKARNFEIPLAGGFQLANYVASLERYLAIGKEVAVYSDLEDCARQIRYYLSNEGERCGISMAGQKRAQAEHTYTHRFENILGQIWR